MTTAVALLVLLAVQDRVKLAVVDRVGDKNTVSMSESRIGTITRVTDGRTRETEVLDRVEARFAEEVLDVTGGRASKVRRHFAEWTKEEISRYTGEPDKDRGRLQGKTVTFVAKEERTEAEGPEGLLDEKDLRRNRLQDIFVRSLPKEDVQTGATWEVDEKGLARELPHVIGIKALFASAAGKGRLDSLKDSIATVVYTVEAKGEQRLLGALTLTLQVTLRVEAATARLRERRLTGQYAVKGTVDALGTTYTTDGSVQFTGETLWTPR